MQSQGAWFGALILSLITVSPGRAQTLRLSAYGAAAANSEFQRVRQARGLGLGVDVRLDFSRFRLEARGLTTSLRADFAIQPDYTFHELEAIATYTGWAPLAFQLGIGRRFTAPDFAAQDVGFLSIGALSETRLTSLAKMGARVAYLPLTRFSGGGGSRRSVELGLRVGIGRAVGRFEGVAEYSFQRINRRTNDQNAPITFSVVRVGMSRRF
jgi:hypothetical protein